MHDIVFGEIYIGGLTNNYLSEYVHYNISEVCPHNYLGVCPQIYIGGLSTKTNIFVLKTVFPYMANACVRESVRTRGMRHGM